MPKPNIFTERCRGWTGWKVEPSPDWYGTFRIPKIAEATTDSEGCARIDQQVAGLLQAAPELFIACRRMLGWIEQARHGTLNDMECAMERKVPDDLMRKAMRHADPSYDLSFLQSDKGGGTIHEQDSE